VDRPDTTSIPTGIALYTLAAHRASKEVIYSYSTSFGAATKLLPKYHRHHIENIYAMVRVADEIVDGSAKEAGVRDPEAELNAFEAETYKSMETGFSTNLILHSFGVTAREVGIGKDIVEPFFYSMRQDLTDKIHDQASFERYVYGSAEVVGLMCLAVFVTDRNYTNEEKLTLVIGARALGAAFQKVNFLRDLAADFQRLGRSYFPGMNVESFDERTKERLVEDIRGDLEKSAKTLPLLPPGARRAVTAAQFLFQELNEKISKTSASELISTRISVSNFRKLQLLIASYLGAKP
jgi:15-cis-phytoene synthase